MLSYSSLVKEQSLSLKTQICSSELLNLCGDGGHVNLTHRLLRNLCGPCRARTGHLVVANDALYQMS
jgi:hypothetical protein